MTTDYAAVARDYMLVTQDWASSESSEELNDAQTQVYRKAMEPFWSRPYSAGVELQQDALSILGTKVVNGLFEACTGRNPDDYYEFVKRPISVDEALVAYVTAVAEALSQRST